MHCLNLCVVYRLVSSNSVIVKHQKHSHALFTLNLKLVVMYTTCIIMFTIDLIITHATPTKEKKKEKRRRKKITESDDEPEETTIMLESVPDSLVVFLVFKITSRKFLY